MRYKVGELEIRSENAAKPMSQASQALLQWIASQNDVAHALDFGCGKLRYAKPLAARCEALTLVDSTIQLERMQAIDGSITSVHAYIKHNISNAKALTAEEFEENNSLYDLALCANVLSTIPIAEIRSQVLHKLVNVLKPDGKCLFVTQYRNSYFNKMAVASNTIPHLDGWIVKSRKGNSYYGIINKEKLIGLLEEHNFAIAQAWINDQSAYVLAKRKA